MRTDWKARVVLLHGLLIKHVVGVHSKVQLMTDKQFV